ncbi:RAF-like serine/threonine-protein kinase 20 isoform X1 [Primulina tabacum]|uniref:RAF-like serine/threonine-protein kinase 20 isoform X1 n=1 Tax=Primulina tabacum TaxID=48773 RepID=UPI003F590A2F
MQLNKASKNTAETVNGEEPGFYTQWTQQDSLEAVTRSSVPVWDYVNNNVPSQRGEFSMEFLQGSATARVVSAVDGDGTNNEKRVGVSDGQIVYEDLARVLGLTRMNSECGSDLTEFASAQGSITEIENAVYVNNESTKYKDNLAGGHKPRKSGSEVSCNQAFLVPNISILSESESSKSLYSSGLGASEGSHSGKMKFLCSFGGKILPRPSDGKLRFVGGETRIISIPKNISWEELSNKTGRIFNQPHSIKYQLPGEDLDALISVSSDEDMQNMIEEYYGSENLEGSQRPRIFLIPSDEPETYCALDTASIKQSDPGSHYVIAVNGIAEADCSSQKYNSSQISVCETVHLIPNSESNPNYEKISSSPLCPLETNHGLGVSHPTEFLSESHNLFSSPSLTHVPNRLADLKFDKKTAFKSTALLGSVEDPGAFGTVQMPIPSGESMCYTDSHGNTLQMTHLILQGENLTPSEIEHNNSKPKQHCHDAVAIMERELGLENPLPQPSMSVGIFSASNNSSGCYRGMPHAFSDSKLQEQGQKYGCSSQEGATQSFSLNLGRPQSSSHIVEDAFLGKPGQFHDSVGFIDAQFQTKESNAEPSFPVSGDTLISPFGSDLWKKFESNYDANSHVEKCSSKNEDLRKQGFILNENGCSSRYGGQNNHECNGNFSYCGENLLSSKVPMVAVELAKKMENVNIEAAPLDCLGSPKQDRRISSCLVDLSSVTNPTTLNDSEIKQSHSNYMGETFGGVTRAETESYSSWTRNLEVGGLIHNSEEQHPDENCYGYILSGLSSDLVLPEVLVCESFEGSRVAGNELCKVRRPEDLHRQAALDNTSLNRMPHNHSLVQNHMRDSLYPREFSLLDDELPNNSDHRVEMSANVGLSDKPRELQDVLIFDNPELHQQKPFPAAQNLGVDLSHAEFPSPDTVASEGSYAVNIQSSTEAQSLVHNTVAEVDANAECDEEGLFSDAMIAEMEADLYGLQIIKNADLEELRELGSGMYGTVYHGKWRGTDVAIKRIKKTCFLGKSSDQEQLTKDFWREAQILSNLHHPNVVAFYGVVPDGAGGTLATVTEFMANGSLRNALIKKDKVLDHRKKLMIAMDAAFGMEYLHSKNIVHFDLKCDNLLVNLRDLQRPICKVGDFGLSRIKRNTLVSGGVRGSLPWMAPELLNGSTIRVSEKVDVFSFGISLWEILTGEEPYSNMHCGAIIGGIVKDTLRPLVPEWCDPDWRKLMEQCWSADPDSRPSFTEIANHLRSMSAALQAKGNTNPVRQMKPNIPSQKNTNA